MKQHRILTIIIFLMLGVVLYKLGQTFLRDRQIESPKQEYKKEITLVDMSLVTEIPITSNSKYGTVSGAYPQFRNADGSFNDHIRNAVFIAQAEFENNSKENWIARVKTANKNEKVSEFPEAGDFTFSVKTDYVQVNQDTISILITVAGFSGGAHGYESMLSFNYDVKNGKEISMQDVFGGDANYLNKVSEFSRKDLIDQFNKKLNQEWADSPSDLKIQLDNINNMIIPGTEPKAENFSVFTIVPGFMNIYFSQYQVAPYVYGSQMVKMPLN